MPNERFSDDSRDRSEVADGEARRAELAAHTRLGLALLVLSLLSAALLGAASWVADAPGAAGGPHPEIAAMQHGGPSAERGGALLAIGGLFGAAQIAFFGFCFALGMRRRDGLGALRAPLLVGLALYLGVWLALLLSYASYAGDPVGAPRWFGLPVPTAILLFGFWPFPFYFVGLYLRYFERNVLSDAALERFRARVASARGDAR